MRTIIRQTPQELDRTFVEVACDNMTLGNYLVHGKHEVWPAIANLCVEFSVQGYTAIEEDSDAASTNVIPD
jgi:hypothetical protein